MARDPSQPPIRLYWEGRDTSRPLEWVDSPEQADFLVQPPAKPRVAGADLPPLLELPAELKRARFPGRNTRLY